MEYKEATEKLQRAVRKQHDYRNLPRTRCEVLLPSGAWIEFRLPLGEDVAAFCRGEQRFDPKTHQLVFSGSQPELREVIINFETGKAIKVIPETKP